MVEAGLHAEPWPVREAGCSLFVGFHEGPVFEFSNEILVPVVAVEGEAHRIEGVGNGIVLPTVADILSADAEGIAKGDRVNQ